MSRIREVWAPNLEAEMRNIRGLIEKYPYVAMVCLYYNHCSASRTPESSLMIVQDTEFPGVVARPIGTFKTSSDYHYQTMRCNVDLLKIIQVGLTLADEDGVYPQDISTWQFNFHFSAEYVLYLQSLTVCAYGLRLRNYAVRICTHPSRSSCFRSRESTYRDMRRWGSSRTTLQSS